MSDEPNEPEWEVPKRIVTLTDDEINEYGKMYFKPPQRGDEEEKRIFATLMRERNAVAGLRHWIAMAGGNMKRPMIENKVMFIALDMATDMLIDGDVDGATSLLAIASAEVALSVAGKLDIDVAAWADRETEHQGKKNVGGVVLFTDLKKSDDLSGHGIENKNPSGPIGPKE